jgi:hypothetical protein
VYLSAAFAGATVILMTRNEFVWRFVDGSIRVSAEAMALGVAATLAGKRSIKPPS